MRWLAFLLAVNLSAQGMTSMAECGLGKNKDHPCHCVEHTSKVQNDWVQACLIADAKKSTTDCIKEMPVSVRDHCILIEQHGNWHQNAAGEHDQSMPDQCTTACLKGHCRCQDGPTCHIMHDPEDAMPPVAPKGKRK